MANKAVAIKTSFLQNSRPALMTYHALALLCLIIGMLGLYFNYFADRFHPNVFVDDVAVARLSKEEAKEKILAEKYQDQSIDWNNANLILSYQDTTVEEKLKNLEITDNLDETLDQAFTIGHSSNWFENFKNLVFSRFQAQRFYSHLSYKQEKVDVLLGLLSEKISLPEDRAQAQLQSSGQKASLVLNRGSLGQSLNFAASQELISQRLEKNLKDIEPVDFEIEVLVEVKSQELNEEQAASALSRAEKLVGKSISFTYNYQRFILNDQDLIAALVFTDGISQDSIDQEFISKKIESWALAIDQPAQNAEFFYDPQSMAVSKFVPDHPATVLDQEQTKNQIVGSLQEMLDAPEGQTDYSFDLAVSEEAAAVTLAQSNNLGIKEIIGYGESWYDHSIPARIHNVALTARKLNNILVPPGEEFSFNRSLGDVSTKTEYKAAYIIQDGKTVLAPGGGVCQVSSTLFRALLDAGLKITRRLPHSYRVSYYEIGNEPGFDATVYSGNTDLRFINDTDNYLLLHFETDSDNFYMNVKIYGTSDGRTNEIVDYRKWDYRPAAATVYIEDPSLPAGSRKQIDWSATGIKAEFTNIVRDKNGEILYKDYYYSNYQPWSAKFLVGTGG